MNVFDLAAVLRLNKDEYDKGLNDAESEGSKFGKGLKTGAAVAAGAVAAVGTAAAAAGTALVKNTGEVAAYGDNIDKMSQKMGISAEAYQEWDAIMRHSGTTIDALKPSMKTLANAAQEGAEEFEKLGISQEEVKSLSQEDLFSRVISGLQGMEEGTERTALTSKLLGRGATELGALLNTSAEETEAMRQRVHELGGVMSDEAVKASAKYQDTLQDMSTAFDGLKRNLVGEFMPGITDVMAGLTDIFSGDSETGLGKISEGIGGIVDKLTEVLPELMKVGSQIVMSLGQAIIDNLPELAKSSVDTIMTLAQGLIDNLPMIIQTGLEVLLALTQGIVDNLPTLIPAIVDAVMTIAETLTEPKNLLAIINAGIEILVALTMGILKAVPRLLEGIGKVFVNIGTALGEKLGELYLQWKEWQEDLHEKIVNALKNVLNKLKEWFTDVKTKVKSFFSQVKDNIVEWAKERVENVAKFFTNIVEKLKGWVESVYSNVTEFFINIKIKLKEKAEQIKEKVKTFFEEQKDKFKSWGKDLIDNFVGGLKEKIDNVVGFFKNMAEKIKDLIGFSEPKEGPLSNFHTFAPDMMKLFAQGIKDNEDMLKQQVAESFDFSDMATSPDLSMTSTAGFGVPDYTKEDMAADIRELLMLFKTGRAMTAATIENTRELGRAINA